MSAARTRDIPEVPALPEPDRRGDLPHPREVFHLDGQDGAERQIVETLRSGKIPHAWLFCGPEGIGKATLAYRFVRTVLSRQDTAFRDLQSLDVAPDDPSVRRITARSHPNLAVIRRPYDDKTHRLKTAITVDEVRNLNRVFNHHAADGGWRVAIIDSADDMNRNAANALLKTLEEPPPRSLIILIAHRPARLLPTIRSRCRKLVMPELGADALMRILERHALNLEPAQIEAVARLSEGSAGRAVMLASAQGLELYRDLSDLIAGLPDPDPEALHDVAGRVGARGAEQAFDLATDFLQRWMARIMTAAATQAPPPDILRGDGETALRLARAGALDGWIEAWDKVRAGVSEGVALNLDRKHLFLTAIFTLQSAARASRSVA